MGAVEPETSLHRARNNNLKNVSLNNSTSSVDGAPNDSPLAHWPAATDAARAREMICTLMTIARRKLSCK